MTDIVSMKLSDSKGDNKGIKGYLKVRLQSSYLVLSSSNTINLQSKISEINKLNRQYESLFLWYDGPLVESMKQGDMLLVDEISLAGNWLLNKNLRISFI